MDAYSAGRCEFQLMGLWEKRPLGSSCGWVGDGRSLVIGVQPTRVHKVWGVCDAGTFGGQQT